MNVKSWAAAAGYLVVMAIMLPPICSFRDIATASRPGDERLEIWTLAWVNHAMLDGVPSIFDANRFYPARNSLAYSDNLREATASGDFRRPAVRTRGPARRKSRGIISTRSSADGDRRA